MSELGVLDFVCAACLVCQAFFLRSAREVDFLMQKSVFLQRALWDFVGKYSVFFISESAKKNVILQTSSARVLQNSALCDRVVEYFWPARTPEPASVGISPDNEIIKGKLSVRMFIFQRAAKNKKNPVFGTVIFGDQH